MRKFILTGAKFTGQIELVFDDREFIVMVDFQKANLNKNQTSYFLNNSPAIIPSLEGFVKDNHFTCVESDFEITWEMFWNKYAMKVDKKRAEAVWSKLSKNSKIAAFYGIDKYERYLRRTATWRNKMEPKTYLANERWEDEW